MSYSLKSSTSSDGGIVSAEAIPSPKQSHYTTAIKVMIYMERKAFLWFILFLVMTEPALSDLSEPQQIHPPIPIHFHLNKPGYVTLVIDNAKGNRVRNIISDTLFPAGENTVWWDGLDDIGRLQTNPNCNFVIVGKMISPGRYRVRGLEHPPINLRYQFTIYNPGVPPWATADLASGWLANHTPPSDALFIPHSDSNLGPAPSSTNGEVLVCSAVTEGGSGLAWLDLNGQKLHGQMWVGGVWTGATCLARDTGHTRVPGVYAYAGSAWAGGGYDGPKPELRLAELLYKSDMAYAPRDNRFGHREDRPLLAPNAPYSGLLPPGAANLKKPGEDYRYTFPDNAHIGLSGLAVYNGLLVASLPKMNQLLWVNAARRKIIGTVPMQDPRGVDFDSRGRLLVLSGEKLLRYAIGKNPLEMSSPQVVISRGLQDPQRLTLDGKGDILISDWGSSNQVKLFTADAKFIRSIGKPGKPILGPYDPLRMHHPYGVTIDSHSHLWVAETDFIPKRVSVWTLDGRLIKAFYGPMEYGGGGYLDAYDKTLFFYSGMEFKLNWKTGENTLIDNYYRPEYDTLGLRADFKSRAPETAIEYHRRLYLTDCYNVSPTNGADSASIWLMKDGVAKPVAAFGNTKDWTQAQNFIHANPPKGYTPNADIAFLWTDTNGDGKVEPGEVHLFKGMTSGITVMPDLSFVAEYLDGKAMRFSPTGFTRQGAPFYHLSKGVVLAAGTRLPRTSGGGQTIVGKDGWTILTVPTAPFASQASMEGVKNGVPIWTYPSLWPGLHPSHDAPMPHNPGELIGTTRLLGDFVKPIKSDAGQIWAINGNKGNVYLFTQDGLFVAILFKDCRISSWSAPHAIHNMLVNDLSLEEENFWPSITQVNDGNIYLTGGAAGGNVMRIDGLQGIQKLPSESLEVTPGMIHQAQAYFIQRELIRQQKEAKNQTPMIVNILTTPPLMNGSLKGWQGSDFVTIDNHASAAALISQGRLYAAFKTNDPNLLVNSGMDLPMLFKTGGGLDLMLNAIVGGERLLVTKVNGKPVAVLYRPQVNGIPSNPVSFSSPQRIITFDHVDDVSGQVNLVEDGKGDYEFSVPLSLLSFTPTPKETIKGDIGILRGNGFATLQRTYWFNKATGLVSDIPSEVELTPQLWGTWMVEGGK